MARTTKRRPAPARPRSAAKKRTAKKRASKKDRALMVKKPKRPAASADLKISVYWTQEHIDRIAGLTAKIDRLESERESHRAAAKSLTEEINTTRDQRDAMTRPTLPVDDRGQHNFLADAEKVEPPVTKNMAPKNTAKSVTKDGLPNDLFAMQNIPRAAFDALYGEGFKTIEDLFEAHAHAMKNDTAWFDGIKGLTLEYAGAVAESIKALGHKTPKGFAPPTKADTAGLAGGLERDGSES